MITLSHELNVYIPSYVVSFNFFNVNGSVWHSTTDKGVSESGWFENTLQNTRTDHAVFVTMPYCFWDGCLRKWKLFWQLSFHSSNNLCFGFLLCLFIIFQVSFQNQWVLQCKKQMFHLTHSTTVCHFPKFSLRFHHHLITPTWASTLHSTRNGIPLGCTSSGEYPQRPFSQERQR